MKRICNNKYLKVYKFSNLQEAVKFCANQNSIHSIELEEDYGEFFYCCVCLHSLTRDPIFSIVFGSDQQDDNLNILFWEDLIVIDTGQNIYLINHEMQIKAKLEITSPLMGLYLINEGQLLVLEETFLRIISREGVILKDMLFDLIERVEIDQNKLYIDMDQKQVVVDLLS